jgi:hypothetical protein
MCNPDSIKKFCDEFFLATGNKVILIERYDKNQPEVTELYRLSGPLPSDLNLSEHVKYVINFRDKVSIIVNKKGFDRDATVNLLAKYFLDSMGKTLSSYEVSSIIGTEVPSWQLKKRQHKAYNSPLQDSVGSLIEEMFEKALIKARVNYKKQVKIHIEGELFTDPDFLIDERKIAIYCDGSEFHSSKERIIKDKQQDRFL